MEYVKFIVEIALNAKEKSMKFNNFVFAIYNLTLSELKNEGITSIIAITTKNSHGWISYALIIMLWRLYAK